MAFSLFRATALAALLTSAGTAQAATDVTFWHSMEGPLGERVAKHAQDFNASQSDYVVHASYKGNYGESLNSGSAALRADIPPVILQVCTHDPPPQWYASL